MSLKVKNIRIEGMHNMPAQSFSFNPGMNYLYGPNGVGKSTILQAVQLALLGYIPGFSKTNAGIFSHACSRCLAVTLTLKGDDGGSVTITRSWTKSKTGISSLVETSPENYDVSSIISQLELPVFNFSEFMNMTANNMKDWFIKFLPKSTVAIDWKQQLSDCLMREHVHLSNQSLIDETLAGVDSTVSGSEQARRFNEHLKGALSAKKSELTRAEGALQSLIHYDDVDETISPVELRAQLDSKREALRIATESKAIYLSNCKAEESIRNMQDMYDSIEVDPNYQSMREELETVSKEIESLTSRKDEESSKSHELTRKIEEAQKLVSSKGICPYSNSVCESIMETVKQEQSKLEEYNKELDAAQQLYKKLSADLDAAVQRMNLLKHQISELYHKYETRNFLRSTITPISGDYSEENIQWLNSEISNMESQLEKALVNERYNSLIEQLTKDKFQVEEAIEAYKAWINLTGVNGLQSSDDAIAPFIVLADQISKRLEKFFQKPTIAKFNLESKSSSFSFGVEREGNYIPFDQLSSGEKCLYTLALMMSLIEASDSELKLILVDDLLDHLDDANVDTLFEALKGETELQLIFAGVKNTRVEDLALFVMEV